MCTSTVIISVSLFCEISVNLCEISVSLLCDNISELVILLEISVNLCELNISEISVNLCEIPVKSVKFFWAQHGAETSIFLSSHYKHAAEN